jgi:hypothetical protein
VCRDPKDDMVFACAVKAESEIIISGDNDLLSVKTFRGGESKIQTSGRTLGLPISRRSRTGDPGRRSRTDETIPNVGANFRSYFVCHRIVCPDGRKVTDGN